MVIKLLMLFIGLLSALLNAQDSVRVRQINEEYSRYFVAAIKSVSPSGQFLVKNNVNAYGMDDNFLINTKSGKSEKLINGKAYHFIDDQQLVIETFTGLSFVNLKDYALTTFSDQGEIKLINKNVVLTFHRKEGTLSCYTASGKLLWKKDEVLSCELFKDSNNIVYATNHQLFNRNLETQNELIANLTEKPAWLKIYGNEIWMYTKLDRRIDVKSFDSELKSLDENAFDLPDGYQLGSSPEFFGVRENRYFVLPLLVTSKKTTDKKVKISYTLKNESPAAPQLGIYDIKARQWLWKPNNTTENNISFFVSDKGDFLTYNISADLVENKNNPILEMSLVREYGRKTYALGKMHSSKENFYFDAVTNQLLYFKERQWWIYNLANGKSKKVFDSNVILNDPSNNGLNEMPLRPVVKTTDDSKVIISSAYDLFLLDLKTANYERITDGEPDHIKYKFSFENQSLGSGWNANPDMIDLNNDHFLSLFNEKNFHSGVAKLQKGKVSKVIYGDYNFGKLLRSGKSVYAMSKTYQHPLEVFEISSKRKQKIFTDNESNSFNNAQLKFDLFKYKTSLKESNAVLLYPKDYDPKLQYPMIVQVYEDASMYFLDPIIPNLHSTDGFNYSHYVQQGYFVLLPQLQYEQNKVADRFIESLTASVKQSFRHANIDRDNVAVIGMSFGGYEAGLAMSNTSLFKTGSLGVMISDLIPYSFSYTNMFPEPNYIRAETQQHSIAASPFDDWNLYNNYSPLYHLKKVKQPVMIWFGGKDKNVPPAQSIAYFIGLKRLGKAGVLLEYPDEQHHIVKRENRQDLSVRIWQWMEYFLKNKPPADWIKPIIKEG